MPHVPAFYDDAARGDPSEELIELFRPPAYSRLQRRPNWTGIARGDDPPPHRANTQIADRLRQAAAILAAQAADPFRIAAYRKAAESVLASTVDLGTIAERGGRRALAVIPGVGVAIGGAIAEM